MTVVPLPYEIAHCSSWDDDHEPEQLVASSPGNRINRSDKTDDDVDIGEPDALPSNNKVKGWQTPKCPTYPQDLIIRLLCGPARISKVQVLSHHYKIATKIDVYIGILKDPSSIQEELDEHVSPEDEEDEDDMVIEFTRLGYVSLDNNTRAQYRARELKSIKVNADGEYVRLVVRSCHRNRLNTYNQVGLLALNVLGQPLRHEAAGVTAIPSHMARYLQHPLDESSILSSSTRRTSVSSSQSLSNRLSASGVLDIELQQWISALMHAEEEAARDESYQTAKVYKDISDKLSRFGKIVIDLELGKKQAVESKDYDEAEKIKADICEIKRSAEQLLEQAGIHITRDGRVVPAGSSNGAIADAEYADDENDIIPESLRGPSYPSNNNDDILRHSDVVSRHHHDNENDTTLISYHDNNNNNDVDDDRHHHLHHSNQETTQQDRLYDEAIEKWTNFDAYITPSNNEGISQNDSTTHQSSPTSSLSTDAAEMLLPPHLTSYGGHNSSPLIGRDTIVEDHDNNGAGGMEKPIDLRRVSMSDLMAPSLSASVARKHSLRGMTVEEQQQFFNEHQVVDDDGARIQQKPMREQPVDPECIPEPLIDAERANCRVPIRVFGEDIVACVLSVKVKCREYGLKQVGESVKLACAFVENNELHRLDELVEDPHHTSLSDDSSSETSNGDDYKEDIRHAATFTKAALMMIQEAVMDSRESIISMTIDIWKDVNAICEVVPHTLVFGLIERAFSGLLMRTNDTNMRIRQPASQLVLDLSEKFYERPYSLLSLYIAKPERIIHNHKDARARIELVSSAVDFLRVIQQQQTVKKSNGDVVPDIGIIPLDDLMAFVVTYLNHSHDDVRQAAVELVIDISEQVGFPSVSKYIDKDLRLSLAETVKKVAESREAAQDKSSSKASSFGANGTVAELRALAAKASSPSEKKSSQATKKVGDSTKRRTAGTTTAADRRGKADSRTTTAALKKTTTINTTNGTRTSSARSSTRGANTTTSKTSSKNTTTTTSTSASRQEDPLLDDKNICIFCEESNPNFNEDTLISHYYDECPVLTSCPRCQIILEISTLSDHTFKDCAKRHLVKQCTRCKQAVPVEQWLQHTLKQTCSAVADGETRCPLCMESIDPVTDSQWKAHLLNGDGCPKNPRKVRRNKVAASAVPATSKPIKADAPKSTTRGATKTPTTSLRRKK